MRNYRNYNTKTEESKGFWVALALIAAVIMILAGAIIRQERERESLWSVSYPMVNAGIEWTGAGYNGIYEH